jgi:hypothetical protein
VGKFVFLAPFSRPPARPTRQPALLSVSTVLSLLIRLCFAFDRRRAIATTGTQRQKIKHTAAVTDLV